MLVNVILITGKHLCLSAMMVNAFLNKPDKMMEPQRFKKQNVLLSFTIFRYILRAFGANCWVRRMWLCKSVVFQNSRGLHPEA